MHPPIPLEINWGISYNFETETVVPLENNPKGDFFYPIGLFSRDFSIHYQDPDHHHHEIGPKLGR